MTEIGVSIDGLSNLLDLWAKAPQITAEELSATTLEAELLLQREVQDFTPIGVTGGLRAGINYQEPVVLANSVIGVVGTSAKYAEAVELGSRPHWAPIEPLIDWVKARLGISDAEAESVARRVQFGIAAHGTPAFGMFHRGLTASRDQIFAMYGNCTDRIAARLAAT